MKNLFFLLSSLFLVLLVADSETLAQGDVTFKGSFNGGYFHLEIAGGKAKISKYPGVYHNNCEICNPNVYPCSTGYDGKRRLGIAGSQCSPLTPPALSAVQKYCTQSCSVSLGDPAPPLPPPPPPPAPPAPTSTPKPTPKTPSNGYVTFSGSFAGGYIKIKIAAGKANVVMYPGRTYTDCKICEPSIWGCSAGTDGKKRLGTGGSKCTSVPSSAMNFIRSYCAQSCSKSTPTSTDSSTVSINNNPISCTGMGTEPAVFDDFNYLNTDITYRANKTPILFKNSVFGSNIWYTCSNDSVDTIKSRMWYRYNHDDLPINSAAKYVLYGAGTAWGKLAFRMNSGYKPTQSGSSARHPIMRSGLKTRVGTYAARVKFSELENGARLIQSFWIQNAPGDTDAEADVEWNNYFDPTKFHSNIHVTNHFNNQQSSIQTLNGRYYDGSLGHEAIKLTDKYMHSYITGKAKNNGNVNNEWWTIVINITPSGIEYSMQNDGYGGKPGTVWAGKGVDAASWGEPLKINNYNPLNPIWKNIFLPTHGLNSQFGFLFSNSYPFFDPESNKNALSATAEMVVDWFYYSPNQLSIRDIQDQVSNKINRSTYSRFNTTSFSLEMP